jgi:hypothetical protein
MAISKIGSKALVDCSVASADLEDGSITNAKLANSSITINGTSVSLGASASLVDISWQSVITASGGSNTAVAGEGYFIDTTSNTHTVTLPASPSIGDKIAIKDYAGTFGTNNLTIGRNGNNIQGVANDSLISTNRASLILVYSDATKGWLYTVESNVADLELPLFIEATGGTVTTSGDYKIHTFTGDGCFVVSNAGQDNPTYPSTVDYLVVAGGGSGGGSPQWSGGGGAGGFRVSNSDGLPAPTTSPLANPTGVTVTQTTYPVTVGAGGAEVGPDNQGNPGSNSVFSTITSAGGGGGGAQSNNPIGQGADGGSGGGSGEMSSCHPNGGSGNTPPVSPPQGNDGGTSTSNAGAGGGGAGATGSNGGTQRPSPAPGTGGAGGVGSYISPSLAVGCAGTTGPVPGVRYFAGGGGGGSSNTAPGPALGGAGGGGNGGQYPSTPAAAGQVNTGGGGGGSSFQTGGQEGRAGGKGIVIIRYKFQ